MDVKKQERNCVWLVNKFLVNGAKSMGLSSMWGHAWSTLQNLPYQLHNKIRNLVHTECINESKLPSINESKKYCPKSTKLWCNSCTFIVISQMLINYNVCFFSQKIVMVTHTHTHTIVLYMEWKLLSKLFSFLSTYILIHVTLDWSFRGCFKLLDPMP